MLIWCVHMRAFVWSRVAKETAFKQKWLSNLFQFQTYPTLFNLQGGWNKSNLSFQQVVGGDRKSDSRMIDTISFQLVLLSRAFSFCLHPDWQVALQATESDASTSSMLFLSVRTIHTLLSRQDPCFLQFCTSSCQLIVSMLCSDLRLTQHSNVSSQIYGIRGWPCSWLRWQRRQSTSSKKCERTHSLYINWCVFFFLKTNEQATVRPVHFFFSKEVGMY